MLRVLLLSTTTGYQLRSFDDAARRLGIELAFATDACHQLDDPWQDRAIPVRFHEIDASLVAILRAAIERPIDGVVGVGDRPVKLAARVAAALGLPGHPPDAAAASVNKKIAREAFAGSGLIVPWFFELAAEAPISSGLARARFPAVVKPVGLSGSRGVIRADSPAELEAAIGRVRRLLTRPDVRVLRTGLEDTVLIEGFIPGREYAIEGLITKGTLRVLAIFDKPDPLDGPFFEETIYVTPASLSTSTEASIASAVQRAAVALGLWHGPVHAECRVGPEGVFMLEMAARPIGGLCSRVLRFARSADEEPATLEEVLLRHALGEDVMPWEREAPAAAVMMIPIPARGVLKRVDGEANARAVPCVDDVVITAKRDQVLEPLPEAGSYLGFIFARAEDPGRAEAAVREAHRRLRFDVAPSIEVVAGPAPAD
jgi:biotin carboxylase